MDEYVLLDTNIYREMGYKFTENDNFKKLINYIKKSNKKLIVATIVEEELFENIIKGINENIEKYNSALNKLSKYPYINENIGKEINSEEVIKKFEKNFREEFNTDPTLNSKKLISISPNTKGEEIVKFYYTFIKKNEKNIKEIKDFLIWESIIEFAEDLHKKELSQIAFITKNSKDFQTSFFIEKKTKKKIDNIVIYDNINDYLTDNNEGYPFLTEDFILNYINENEIISVAEENKDILINAIESTYSINSEKEIIKLEIDRKYILDFTYNKIYRNKIPRLKMRFKLLARIGITLEHFPIQWQNDFTYKQVNFWEKTKSYFVIPFIYEYETRISIQNENIKSHKLTDFYYDEEYFTFGVMAKAY